MTSSAGRAAPPSARRIAVASGVGTTIEFYDFLIYGTAAALVFPKVFFPALGPTAGLVASFSTFAVAFVARPVGGVVFGHYGDRLGRKRALTLTLLIMGMCTVLVGVLPTAASIGVAAPILLIALRFLQGFAMGGEWAGAALLAGEHAPAAQRGFYSVFPQLGAPLAVTLSSLTFLVTGLTVGDTDAGFVAYGWRIPFLLSLVLVVLGLWVRLRIDETPAFAQAARTARRRPAPVVSIVRMQGRELLVGIAAMTGNFAIFYLGSTYLVAYGVSDLHLPRPTVLAMGIVGGVVFGVVTATAAMLSDRIGRRALLVRGNLVAAVVSVALFPVLDVGAAWSFGLGLAVVMGAIGLEWGVVGALLPELFRTEHRYTGTSLAYNVSAVIGGGLAPIVATALTGSVGSFAVGLVVAALCLLSWAAARLLPETRGRSLGAAETAGDTADTAPSSAA